MPFKRVTVRMRTSGAGVVVDNARVSYVTATATSFRVTGPVAATDGTVLPAGNPFSLNGNPVMMGTALVATLVFDNTRADAWRAAFAGRLTLQLGMDVQTSPETLLITLDPTDSVPLALPSSGAQS